MPLQPRAKLVARVWPIDLVVAVARRVNRLGRRWVEYQQIAVTSAEFLPSEGDGWMDGYGDDRLGPEPCRRKSRGRGSALLEPSQVLVEKPPFIFRCGFLDDPNGPLTRSLKLCSHLQ